MQTHNDQPMPILGKTAEDWAAQQAETAETVTVAAPLPPVRPIRMAHGGKVTDLVTRLIARQDAAKADRELSPVRRSIRQQVQGLTSGLLGPTPTQELNRRGAVEAIATTRNHQGQVRHVYAGTVDPATIAHRRAKGRMAKASRKANRRRG